MGDGDRQEMLIVTGMSGAGRSTVADALEDLGWYVVDNLPPQMLRRWWTSRSAPARRCRASRPSSTSAAATSSRNCATSSRRSARRRRPIMFLDANDAVLVRRFESVRRPHLLQGDGTLLDGIAAERARLAEVREASDIIVDTSDLNIHQSRPS